MLHSKMKKISSYVCLIALFLIILTSTVTSHIYANSAGSNSNIEKTQPVNNELTIEQTTVTEEVAIAHSVIEIPTDELYTDESVVSMQGTTGLSKKLFTVRFENGKEVSKVLTGEEVITKPVDTIKYVGTKPRVVPTIAGTNTEKPAVLGDYIDMNASAYDLSYESCGKRPGDRGYGITASGMQARVGVVAVDPKVIPLGTKMYIVSTDGKVVYGYCTAEDTGGAIKGNKVDLFYNTKSECLQFGRRSVYVYIL